MRQVALNTVVTVSLLATLVFSMPVHAAPPVQIWGKQLGVSGNDSVGGE